MQSVNTKPKTGNRASRRKAEALERRKAKERLKRKTQQVVDTEITKPGIGHNTGIAPQAIGAARGRASIGYGLTGDFPLTIAAARAIKSQQWFWDLGDALVKETGRPSRPGE